MPCPKPSSTLLALALAGAALTPAAARAAAPTQLSQLPVYAGARRAQLEEGEWEEGTLGGKPEVKAYVVDARGGGRHALVRARSWAPGSSSTRTSTSGEARHRLAR